MALHRYFKISEDHFRLVLTSLHDGHLTHLA